MVSNISFQPVFERRGNHVRMIQGVPVLAPEDFIELFKKSQSKYQGT